MRCIEPPESFRLLIEIMRDDRSVLAERAFSMLATGTEPIEPKPRMGWPGQLLAEELPHQYTFDTDPTRALVSSLLHGPLHTWSRQT